MQKDEAGNRHEQREIMKCAGDMGRPLKLFFFNPLMMSHSPIIRLWPQDFFPCYFVSEAEEHTNGLLIKMDGTSKRPIFMIIRELNVKPCKASLLGGRCVWRYVSRCDGGGVDPPSHMCE